MFFIGRKIIISSILLFLMTLVVYAETKLTYPQRQAVQRQASTLKEVEKKIETGYNPDEKKYLIQKLNNVVNDLSKNNCPTDNAQIADMYARVKKAQEALGGAEAPVEKATEEVKPVEKAEPTKAAEVAPKIEEAPQKKENTPVPSSAAEVKLTYPQRQAVDRQVRNLKEMEGLIGNLKEKEPNIKYYPHKIEPGLGYQKKIDGIIDDLTKANCPKENSQVADIYARLEVVKKDIAELETKLQPKFELYDKYTNIANYPAYNDDYEQLKRLFGKYNNSERFYTNETRAKELLSSYKDDAEYFNSLGKKYAPLINFKTGAGEKIHKQMKTVQKHMMSFYDARKAYAETLPGEIDNQMKSAKDMANQAVSEKKPAFFTGGVRQWMERVESSVAMLEAIKGADDEVVKTYQGKHKALKAEIKSMEDSMKEEILAATEEPAEKYAGGDKEELRKMITDAWKKAYPGDKIIKVIMHNEQWERNNKWTYNSTVHEWYATDKSFIAGMVVVKTSDKIATMYPAFINKDHLKGDKITMGVNTKEGAYVVREMLLSNVK